MLRNKSTLILLSLLIVSVAANIWQAGRKHPVSPTSGHHINAPDQWKPSAIKTFRVSTYNIHRGKGTDGIRDLGRAAAILRTADIAGLNEVGGPSLLNALSQIEIIGTQNRSGWLFAPNQTRWYRNYFGNGLLSRFPVEKWEVIPLVHDQQSGRSLRNMISARIAISQLPVRFLVTHLDLGEIQAEQLEFVIGNFKHGKHAVLLGDLNTRPDNAQLQTLFAESAAIDAIRSALPNEEHDKRIDWIITRGFRILGGGKTAAGISDHPNFWVDLELHSNP